MLIFHLHEFVPELANPLQDLLLAVATTGLQSIRQFHYLQLEGGESREKKEWRGKGREQGERSEGEGWKEREWEGGDTKGEEWKQG